MFCLIAFNTPNAVGVETPAGDKSSAAAISPVSVVAVGCPIGAFLFLVGPDISLDSFGTVCMRQNDATVEETNVCKTQVAAGNHALEAGCVDFVRHFERAGAQIAVVNRMVVVAGDNLHQTLETS